MGKYDKYICTTLQKRQELPGPNPEEVDKLHAQGKRLSMEHILWLDKDVIPGAYYGENTFIWPPGSPGVISFEEQLKLPTNDRPMFPHAHDFPELLSWWSTNPDDPSEISSQGLILDDELIPLETGWVAYIPAGMRHMPARGTGTRRVNKPTLHWTSGPGYYTREHSADEEIQDPAKFKIPAPSKPGTAKNEKYIVTGWKQGTARRYYMLPFDSKYVKPIVIVDDTVVPGCEYGCETLWLLPGDKTKAGYNMMKEHTASHGTQIVFTAMNFEDITDLAAEVELYIGGEKHTITKNFGAYIPPDTKVGPMTIKNIKKQIFFCITYPVGLGVTKWRGGR